MTIRSLVKMIGSIIVVILLMSANFFNEIRSSVTTDISKENKPRIARTLVTTPSPTSRKISATPTPDKQTDTESTEEVTETQSDSDEDGNESLSKTAIPTVNPDFPIPPDAKIVLSTEKLAIVQTDLDQKQTVAFYKEAMEKEGYKYLPLYEVISEQVFSMVWDGGPKKQQIVVQGTLDVNGITTISIRYEKVIK